MQQKDSETIQTQQLLEKIDDYESQIEDYKNELDKVNKVRNPCMYRQNYKCLFNPVLQLPFQLTISFPFIPNHYIVKQTFDKEKIKQIASEMLS